MPQIAPAPRPRPRTVLAPPPYAEGPTPLKPLHHRDSKRFAPAPSDMPPTPSAANAPDGPGGDRHAAIQPSLPSIPSVATGSVPDPAGVPAPQATDAHANANESALPAEELPPGTVTLDAPSR